MFQFKRLDSSDLYLFINNFRLYIATWIVIGSVAAGR